LNNLGYRYFLFLTEYLANIDSLEGVYYMNNKFVEIASNDENRGKIEQIMFEGECLRKELIGIAYKLENELCEDAKVFTNIWVDKDPREIFGSVVFQDCLLSEKKYNFKIEIIAWPSGFEIAVHEKENRFELLSEIIPDLKEKYDIDNNINIARYKEKIKLEDYEKLKIIVKEILDNFNEYVKKIKCKA
jgi:hypothetical protein